MKKEKRLVHTKRLVMAALFAAICFGMTMISIPFPVVGYGNLGDCFVVLSGFLLGPVWGAAAAGLGTALADVALGFGIYAPATFVIKAVMAAVAWMLGRKLVGGFQTVWRHSLCCVAVAVIAEGIMIGGYFAYESLLYGVATAIGSLVGNGMQAAICAVLSSGIMTLLRGSKIVSALLRRREDK